MPKKIEKKTSDEQFFDVAKPGTTAADPTSRPVIVGHKSALKKDPMIQEDKQKGDDLLRPSATKSKIKIAPIVGNENESFESEIVEETEKLSGNGTAENTKEKSETETELETEKPPIIKSEDRPQESEVPESSAIDALANEADAKAKVKEAEKAQTAQDEKANALINNKMYFLPITEGGRVKSWERVISWILILLLLTSIGAWYAVDAGYLNIGLELPYDFIKN